MSTAIRLATPEDAAAIVALYAPYVQNTSVTFEYEVPSVAEYRARIEEITRFFPFYILEEDGVPAGYAYAHFFHPRKAYQWVCETTIYVGEGFHRKGYATRLYERLLRTLRAQGFCEAIAILGCPEPALGKAARVPGLFPDRHLRQGGLQAGPVARRQVVRPGAPPARGRARRSPPLLRAAPGGLSRGPKNGNDAWNFRIAARCAAHTNLAPNSKEVKTHAEQSYRSSVHQLSREFLCLQRPPGVRLHAVGHRRQALHELRGRPRRERDQLRQLQVQVTADPLDVQKKNPASPCGARRNGMAKAMPFRFFSRTCGNAMPQWMQVRIQKLKIDFSQFLCETITKLVNDRNRVVRAGRAARGGRFPTRRGTG